MGMSIWNTVRFWARRAAELTKSPRLRSADCHPTAAVVIEAAPGEVIDKISILEIKCERIGDPEKLSNVRRELDALRVARDRSIRPSESLVALSAELRRVNELIWDVEDEIRMCERNGVFGPRFVELARSVYKNNDHRAALKRKINELLQSRILEEKSYEQRGGE